MPASFAHNGLLPVQPLLLWEIQHQDLMATLALLALLVQADALLAIIVQQALFHCSLVLLERTQTLTFNPCA